MIQPDEKRILEEWEETKKTLKITPRILAQVDRIIMRNPDLLRQYFLSDPDWRAWLGKIQNPVRPRTVEYFEGPDGERPEWAKVVSYGYEKHTLMKEFRSEDT